MPSLWSEAFGLVALEAQLRGIPVVSTDAYGLREANLIPELRVPGVKLVMDMKIRTLHRGYTIDELERKLDPDRVEAGATEEERHQTSLHSHFYVASAAEAIGFTSRVRMLWESDARRRELGGTARERAMAFVAERRGAFLKQLEELAEAARSENRGPAAQ